MSYINCVHVMCGQIWPLRTGELYQLSIHVMCGQTWPLRSGESYQLCTCNVWANLAFEDW